MSSKAKHTASPASDPREVELAALRNKLARIPTAGVLQLADALDRLAELERRIGGDWLGNAVRRMRVLLGVAEYADLGRQQLYRAERNRAAQRLSARRYLEALADDLEELEAAAARDPSRSMKEYALQRDLGEREVARRLAAGEPVPRKRRKSPTVSIERVRSAKRLKAERAAYRAKFPRRP